MASRMTDAKAISTAPRHRAASGDSARPAVPVRGVAAVARIAPKASAVSPAAWGAFLLPPVAARGHVERA